MLSHQASRPTWRAAALPLATSLVVGLLGCTVPNSISVSGNVDDDLVTAQAPNLGTPEPDLDAGFAQTAPGSSGGPATGDKTPTSNSPLTAVTAMGSWNRVAAVEVAEGDQVQAGQVLVRMDSEALRANLSVARTDAKVAARQVPVLDSAIEETYDKEDDVNSAIKKINKAIRQLKRTRRQLTVQLSQAKRQLPQLEAERAQLQSQSQQLNAKLRQADQQLAELRAAVAQLPPQSSVTPAPSAAPAAPNREQLLAQVAQLKRASNQLQSGLKQLAGARAQLSTAISRLRTGIPKLESAIGKIDDGLAKARRERSKLRKAKSKIIEARGDLRRTRKLAVVAAQAAAVGIDVAENQKLLAMVIAPASGVIVGVAKVGEVVAAGATVATIRDSGATSITTWLSPEQLSEVCLGSRAAVRADWMSNAEWLDAEITLIGYKADYPPTSFATNEVHLTRAVPVRLTPTRSLAQPPSLPPGAPVDIEVFLATNDGNCSTEATGR